MKSISTEAQLKNLKPKDKPYDVTVANVPGLYVTVGKKSKSYRWNRGTGHKPRKITYGQYPMMSLKQAREAHEKAQLQHQQGTLGVTIPDKPKTITELAERFYQERIVPIRTRPEAVRQVLDHDVIPVIGSLKLEAVSPITVRHVVTTVVTRGAATHAGRVLAIMKQMCKFAVSLDCMDKNPAESLDPNSLGIENNERYRNLTDDEIKIFWNHFGERQGRSLVTSTALLLLLLLGIRTNELIKRKWSDVDFEKKTLTVPASDQKGDRKHKNTAPDFIVPLNKYSISLLERLKDLDETYIFIGNKNNKPIYEKTLGHTLKKQLPMLIKEGDEKYTPHDLRRTFRTRLSTLGVTPHISERCLNHSLGKIIKTYDQHDYLDERREALEKWSNSLERITGNNVVQLRRPA